jgi:hypothetical protein
MKARVILTACGLVTAVWAGAAVSVREWAITLSEPADLGYSELVALTAAGHTIRLLPLVLFATQLGILGVLGWWAARTPRVPIVGDLAPVLDDLRAWLRYTWTLVVVKYGCFVIAYGCAPWGLSRHRSATFAIVAGVVAGLVPISGVAYAASMRRAMQVQAVRQGLQQSRRSPRAVALGGLVSCLLGVAEVGLILFTAVSRAARKEAKPVENTSRPTPIRPPSVH